MVSFTVMEEAEKFVPLLPTLASIENPPNASINPS